MTEYSNAEFLERVRQSRQKLVAKRESFSQEEFDGSLESAHRVIHSRGYLMLPSDARKMLRAHIFSHNLRKWVK